MVEKKELRGIGGWLFLPIIRLIAIIIVAGGNLKTTVFSVLGTGVWATITNPDWVHYHPLFGSLVVMEMLGNLGLLIGAAGLLILLFSKHPWFPKLIIAFFVFEMLFYAMDLLACYQVPFLAQQDHSSGIKSLIQVIFANCIWIPYFLVSKRVKNTFVAESEPAVVVEAKIGEG